MKNRQIFEVEKAILSTIKSHKNYALVKHLRKNLNIARLVLNPIREDLRIAESMKAFQRELDANGPEFGAMNPEQRKEFVESLRAKFPDSKQAAIDWHKANEDMLEDCTDIDFLPAPIDLILKDGEIFINTECYLIFCEAGIISEADA